MKLGKSPLCGIRGVFWVYWYFVRAGALTFGSGGVLLVMQIKKDFAEKWGWLAEQEIWDYYSVGRTLPGLMVSDVVCMFGYRLCGVAGAIAAVLGSATVPLLSIILVVLFYDTFHDNYWVSAVLEGVGAVVVPIMLTASLSMAKGAYSKRICYAITTVCLYLYCTGMGTFPTIMLAALCGLTVSRLSKSEPKEGEPK